MSTYVSLLRGINVGGSKKIKMTELVSLYRSLDLQNVRTYLQSGNVLFDADVADAKALITMLENKIGQTLKIEVKVIMRTPEELQRVIKDNPFLPEADAETNKLYVTFLAVVPEQSAVKQTETIAGGPDKFIIADSEVYLYCPNGYGRTKFSNDFFERKLGVTATTRNWKTVNALAEIEGVRVTNGNCDSLCYN